MKRKRTDFTASQRWKLQIEASKKFSLALASVLDESIFNSLTEGSKSGYTEPTGSEDM